MGYSNYRRKLILKIEKKRNKELFWWKDKFLDLNLNWLCQYVKTGLID